jgi:hypothetical protein
MGELRWIDEGGMERPAAPEAVSPGPMSDADNVLILDVLNQVKSGDGIFRSRQMQSYAWHCCDRGLVVAPIAVYPEPDEVTRAKYVQLRGAWKWPALTQEGEGWLERGGPPERSVGSPKRGAPDPELTPKQLDKRTETIESARRLASE